jgi:excisionase family DNA binding protein
VNATHPESSDSKYVVPIVLTAAEVGHVLRVATKTVYKLKDCDGLPFRRFGGSVRFYQHEVLDWMENQSEPRSSSQGG